MNQSKILNGHNVGLGSGQVGLGLEHGLDMKLWCNYINIMPLFVSKQWINFMHLSPFKALFNKIIKKWENESEIGPNGENRLAAATVYCFSLKLLNKNYSI